MYIMAKRTVAPSTIVLAANVIILLAAFPYISLVDTRFDTQPWAVIAATLVAPFLFLATNKFALPRPLWLLLLIALYSTAIYMVHSDAYYGLRSLSGYFSVVLLAFVGYKTWVYIKPKVYLVAIGIWFWVGVIQVLHDRRFGSWLLPRLSTGESRGVTSLAVEPSYYAIICLFFLILNEIFYQEGKFDRRLYLVLIGALVVQIVSSLSVLGILFLLIFGIIKLFPLVRFTLQRFKIRISVLLPTLIALVAVGLFFQVAALQQSRAGTVASRALSDPTGPLYTDSSISDRALHVILPLNSLRQRYGLGMGLGTWDEQQAFALFSSSGKWVQKSFNRSDLSASGRIMSGWGTPIYELGLVGVVFVATAMGVLVVSVLRNQRMRSACITSTVVIVALLFMAVPLAFPLFGYLLGVHLYYGYADWTRRIGQRLQRSGANLDFAGQTGQP